MRTFVNKVRNSGRPVAITLVEVGLASKEMEKLLAAPVALAAASALARNTAGFASRIRELDARVDDIGPRIDAAGVAQERVLADIAVRELESQKRRLASYATQAQFALAAIYDGATAGVAR